MSNSTRLARLEAKIGDDRVVLDIETDFDYAKLLTADFSKMSNTEIENLYRSLEKAGLMEDVKGLSTEELERKLAWATAGLS